MNCKHTPGPWHIDQPFGPSGAGPVWGPHGGAICCYVSDEATARLIAAAPDLLAALRLARAKVGTRMDEADCTVLDAAIAKATGATA